MLKNTHEGSTFIVRGGEKQRPWCDQCKRLLHTKETCWKLNGKPPPKRKSNDPIPGEKPTHFKQASHIRGSNLPRNLLPSQRNKQMITLENSDSLLLLMITLGSLGCSLYKKNLMLHLLSNFFIKWFTHNFKLRSGFFAEISARNFLIKI